LEFYFSLLYQDHSASDAARMMAGGDGRASRHPSRRPASLRVAGLLWMRPGKFKPIGFMGSIVQSEVRARTRVICPSGGVREILSSPRAKNISLAPSGKSPARFRVSRLDEEGRYARIVTKRGAGCGGRDDVVCA
jgi:hypothetical protein